MRTPRTSLRRRSLKPPVAFVPSNTSPSAAVFETEDDSDVNLNADRIGILHSYFGSVKQFTGAAWFGLEVAENELARVTDLTAQCEKARAAAVTSLTIRRVQAEARKAAGRIVNDTESYALDIAVADALVAGLAEPAIKVISVTCLLHAPLAGRRSG